MHRRTSIAALLGGAFAPIASALPVQTEREGYLVLPFNAESKNGYIYTEEGVRQCLGDSPPAQFFGCLLEDDDLDGDLDISNICFQGENPRIDDRGLVVDLVFGGAGKGKIAEDLFDEGLLVIRPKGSGVISEGKLTGYRLISLSAIPVDEDALATA